MNLLITDIVEPCTQDDAKILLLQIMDRTTHTLNRKISYVNLDAHFPYHPVKTKKVNIYSCIIYTKLYVKLLCSVKCKYTL